MKKVISLFLLVLCLFSLFGCEQLDRFIYTKDISESDFEFSYTYKKGEYILVDIVAKCEMRDACVRVEYYSSDNPENHSTGGGAYNFDLSAGEKLDYGGHSLETAPLTKQYDSARLIVISGKKR
jgi:hypothetical protein